MHAPKRRMVAFSGRTSTQARLGGWNEKTPGVLARFFTPAAPACHFREQGRLSEGIGVTLLYDYFFSYAHENFDADLERFANDLRTRLAALRGRPAQEVAFTDGGSLLPGVRWKPELARALGNARVFIYVRSPQYFQRPFCGKEWSVFESRLSSTSDPTAARRLMVPLHWIPTTYASVRLPTSLVDDTQYTFERFGATYGRYGLSEMMKADGRPGYAEFLSAFVQYVAGLMTDPALALPVFDNVDLDAARDAFAVATAGGAPSQVPTRQLGQARRRAGVLVVAATRDQALAANPRRATLESYADDALFWAPFAPAHTASVGPLLQQWVGQEGFIMESIRPEQLGDAIKERKPVILVVDPWSLTLSEYERALRESEWIWARNTGAVVVFSPADADVATRDSLFESVFGDAHEAQDSDVHRVGTLAELEGHVKRLLNALWGRMPRRSGVVRAGGRQAPPTVLGSPSR
jgi:FxsC-like protein